MKIQGVLVIDKPLGLVSMRAVERVKRALRIKRAGHAGTLDPAATGVLPVCLGEATKIASHILGEEKEYVATVRLGLETTTCDLEGEVTARAEPPVLLTPEQLAETLATLTGEITQRPPAYSAIRVEGERLYEKARRGEAVAAPERQVVVHELETLRVALPDIELRVRCGKGTYVRTLAADLGRLLGCGGCLAALRRTRVGALDVERAVTLDEVAARAAEGSLSEVLLSMSEALAHYPAIPLTEEGISKIRKGQAVGLAHTSVEALVSPEEHDFVRCLDEAGELVALAAPTDRGFRPKRVFNAL